MTIDPRTSVIKKRFSGIKRVIAVTGWKGGIGKSVTASILSLILSKNGKLITDPTIGSLLQHSFLGNILDEYFINYFCDDLYNERNPVLHGRNVSNFNERNASKKLATIEYLLDAIESYNKRYMLDRKSVV